jgi:hypothetical protein
MLRTGSCKGGAYEVIVFAPISASAKEDETHVDCPFERWPAVPDNIAIRRRRVHMLMNDKPGKSKSKKQSRPRRGKPVSIYSAILFLGAAGVVHERPVVEQALRLALRSSEPWGNELRGFFSSKGMNVEGALGPDASRPTAKEEVLALAEPYIKMGRDWAAWAQIADIYYFNTARSPENVVYMFYNLVRFYIAGDKRPTKEQYKQIWDFTLRFARVSRKGVPHWKKLKEESPTALEDWLAPVKETARKRYKKTFLRQKRRADRTAEESLKNLMEDFFGNAEDA